MQIQVNGEPQEFPGGISVQELLAALGLTGKRLAVELNAEIVPRSQHDSVRLQENDQIEIVHAIGGG